MKNLVLVISLCLLGGGLWANPILTGPRISELMWVDGAWQLELYNCYFDQNSLDGCYMSAAGDTAWFNTGILFLMDTYLLVQQSDLQETFTIDPTGTEINIYKDGGEWSGYCAFGPGTCTEPPLSGESLSCVGDITESFLFVRDASPSMGQPNDNTNNRGVFSGWVHDQDGNPLENVVVSLSPTSLTATTDATGTFTLQPYALQYDVHLQYYSLAMADTTISIAPDSQNSVEYQLFVPVGAHVQITPPQVSISVHPNPFNPSTEIMFNLTANDAEDAKIEIFNARGRKVRELGIDLSSRTELRDLSCSVTWDGTDAAGSPVASGIYFARLVSGGMHLAQAKMLLLQ